MKKKDNEEEILRIARERFKQAYDSDSRERELAEYDLRFAIDDEGCQWDENIRASRQNDISPRPCLVINKIPEKVDQIEGEFRQSRPSIKVRGVDSKSDPKIAEILDGLIRQIEHNSNARDIYNMAYTSMLLCGRGAWRVNVVDSTEDVFLKDIEIQPIPNVFSVYWDVDAIKPDKSDARWVFVTEKITKEEFKRRYPDQDIENWQTDGHDGMTWCDVKEVRIAEYWWKETVEKKVYRVKRYDDNNQQKLMTVEEIYEGEEIQDEKVIKRDKIRYCIMAYNTILDGIHDDWEIGYIPIVLVFGKTTNINGQEKHRGMVRFAKTPQQMYNYWSSTVTEQVALAPKSPFLVTPRMIGNHQAQWNQAHIRNFPYLLYDPDPSAPTVMPQRQSPPQMSSAIANELVRMEHDIMSAMGIYQASLGDEGQEKSGKAILARQRQGNIGSFVYTDNMAIGLTYCARIIIALIPYVYDTERILKIRGKDDAESFVPINANQSSMMPDGIDKKALTQSKTGKINDLTVGKYDVVVSIGPSYATQRQESLELLLDLIKTIPPIGQVAMDLIVKNIDAPGAQELYERVKKLIPPEISGDEEALQKQQAQAQQMQQPDMKTMAEMTKVEMMKREQDRKDFETQAKAIKDLHLRREQNKWLQQ
ncbi:MAG: hypothetical protein HQK79_14210 [Desulfobacterales bacterium]|nr:hypothetical protein [Desulfobacterales bacterium]